MTQQEQLEFKESYEDALLWMQAVQERLRLNDNTQGPRAALEARLRETEKIRESEQDGRLKMDVVLVSAESLLKNGDEEMKNQTHSKLKELKSLWDETSTYIIHCHSRIEWVWLHWSEYLKAYEEFSMWLVKTQRTLEPQLELQLGLREKLWQLDHHLVLCSDVKAQSQFLERLLDEAAALYNRTQDTSVDEHAQDKLQDAYNNIRTKAEERLVLVQKVSEEHQQLQHHVHEFQKWLVVKTDEVSRFTELEDTTENRLQALQDLDVSVAHEEQTLQYIEGLGEEVKVHTSPAGAENIAGEVEELRLAWQRLRQCLVEIREELQSSLDSQSRYLIRREELQAGIAQLRTLVQKLSRELELRDGERTEEHMVNQWRRYTAVRNALLAEEPRVEQLKAQLKELFRFPQDRRELSDDVLSAVKEYQSVKGRSSRLSSESETALRQVLQDPLHGFSQWSQAVSQVLEASAEVTEFSHIALLVQNIEKLLKHSVQLQERLSPLQMKAELLTDVFGQEKACSLLEELSADMKKRELLHNQLLQRKNRLQGLISRTKDFGDAYDSIQKRLISIKERFLAAGGLQPDILAKKSQADQLKVIKRDLEDSEAHITALEMLVSSSPTNRTRFERLYADWKLLYKAVRGKVNESEENISQHESFHDSMLNMEKWLMIMRQKLESFRGSSGEWSVENRQHEAERALGEFPDKELQLHETEGQGQAVLAKTSEEGKVHIQRDLKRLRESWMSLHSLSLNLYRLLNEHGVSGGRDSSSFTHQAFSEGDGFLGLDQRRVLTEGDGSLRGSSSSSRARADGHPAQELGHWPYEDSGLGRGSEFGAAGRFVTGYDGRDQRSGDGQFSPGIKIRSELGVKVDEVDSGCVGGGFGGLEQKGLKGGGGGSRSGGRTREWVEEHSSGVQDVDGQFGLRINKAQYSGDDQTAGAGIIRPFQTSDSGEFRQRQPSPYKPPTTGSAAHGSADVTEKISGFRERGGDWQALRREFEAWLRKENDTLSSISNNQRVWSSKELKKRQNVLKGLRAEVSTGQVLFQQLMDWWKADAGVEDKEELRYRWMLYKSKLKEAEDLKAPLKRKTEGVQQEELVRSRKEKTCCGFLYRVCRVALPLQLLLLALLLLAFLLPMMDEGTSCSLSNNFARSFNIMLRYHGPPPT
ncbi:nesprin-3 isoform X1 [Astyanax mexicanus]|uniref:nesprin-3 isoform X1 n=1 Tax=Astyanax mexicanus TaxID=7994 RepID=UPI0020CAFE66|nr:nesprin-3 isoform X1 [Astyanax mexicanus]